MTNTQSNRLYAPAALLALLFGLLLLGSAPTSVLAQQQELEITAPQVLLQNVPFAVTIKDPSGDLADGTTVTLSGGADSHEGALEGGEVQIDGVIVTSGEVTLEASATGAAAGTITAEAIPGWAALLPALIAIIIALSLRQVLPALFLGIWIGGALTYGLSLTGLWHGLLDTVTVYILSALNDEGHLSVIVFSLMIGGMVGVISKNGGTQGIVKAIISRAGSPQKGQITTGILGVAIFFDDYANTLIVGNTMRPITDRLRVSREKLAYIVDSTAAPVATIALVTTWIGFEVGLIGEAAGKIDDLTESGYSIFLNSILYSFYPLLAILFVFLVAITGRDFGPMLHAERRARSTGQVSRPGAHVGESPDEANEREPKLDRPQRALNAVIPVLILVFGTLIGIYVTGAQGSEDGAPLRDIIGNGDSYKAMMWSSLLAVVAAAALSIGQRILNLTEVVDAWYAGVRSMLLAIIILVLAWSLSGVNDALHTGDFLVSTLGEKLSPQIIPLLVFVLSAFTAFATGSSWGVMGIMMPLVVPLAWAVMAANGMANAPEHMHLLYSSVAAVLAGAVWGDHCSPISDTTILSSLASGCDHIDHVRTQIPYAMVVGAVAILIGTLPVAHGYAWWMGLLGGAVVLVIILRLLGRKADMEST